MKQIGKHITLWVVFLLCACLVLAAFVAMLPEGEEPAPTEETEDPEQTTETTYPPPTENVFTPLDFGYEGEYLTCLTAPCLRGIDVSAYQEEVDWEQVKESGVEFVIIRVGYRGSQKGVLFEDSCAQSHYQGARAAGLKVGGYFFSQAITPEEAVEEAEFAMEITKDWELDMPLAYDWEIIGPEERTKVVDARLLTDISKAFCRRVEDAGLETMVYFNPEQSDKQMYLEELTEFGFWLAMYTDHMDYEYKVDMWQYTCTGSVPGISGNTDINLFFLYDETDEA